MDSMGSIVPHDTVVMLYKLHTQHRATGWQRQTTMLENTFQFCAQQQQRKRRWWWRGWDGEDVSVGGCQRQQLTGKQTEGLRDRQTHRLSVWKRKEGSQLKRSRVREDAGGEGPHCVCCSLCGTGNSAYEWFFRSLSVFVLQIYCQRNVLSEVFSKFIWLACRLALYSVVPRCTRLAWLHAF